MTPAIVVTLCLAAAKPGLMVLEPDLKGATPVEGAVVGTAIANGARELETFEVMTATDMRTLLGVERQKQLMGAATEATNSLAESLGAQFVVSSIVAKVGAKLEVDLRLIDTKDGKVLSQKKLSNLEKSSEVSNSVQGITQELLGVLLATEQGSVYVRSSEEGSEVRLDGKLVGSTPMASAFAIARGRHRLEVGKDGFITAFKPVVVQREQTTVEDVRLVPSPDYINAYVQRNKRMRMGAWISAGAAVALLAGAVVVDRALTEKTYQDQFVPRREALRPNGTPPLGDGAKIYTACAADAAACSLAAQDVKSQIEAFQAISIGLGIGAILTAGLSAYFFIAGEDPNKYSRVSMSLLPEGGAAFALSGSF